MEDALWGLSGLARLTSQGTCEELRVGDWLLTSQGFARHASGQLWSLCAAGQKFEMCSCRGKPALVPGDKVTSQCRGLRLPTIDAFPEIAFI